MAFPEVRRQRRHAGIQNVRVFERLVAVVVLRMHAEHGGLDAQVDVLRDEHDARFRIFLLERDRLAENRIVGAARQRLGQGRRQLARLEIEPARRKLACRACRRSRTAPMGSGKALVDLVLVEAAHEIVEESTDLAHVARLFGQAFLVGVELLEHHHRQEHVVFFEPEDRSGVVHQHVGIQHEESPLLHR